MPFDPRNEKGERIDKLQENLYSRGAQDITAAKRKPLSPHQTGVNENWNGGESLDTELRESTPEHKETSIFTKIFFASVIFFLVAAGIASYVLLGGFNVISSKNVDITVQGPISISAGEELVMDVTISNNNNAALEEGKLLLEYPEGTRMSDDITKELVRDVVELETIPSGRKLTKTVRAVLFGEKDSVKQIRMTVDYKAHGSNASFSKEKTYDISIKSSPVLMEVTYPKEVNAGQEVTFNVSLASNSTTNVRDLVFRADYPFGFSFIDSNPKATAGNNVWRVGDFAPNEKRTIAIRGKIEGQNDEERTFRFNTGTSKPTDENQIGIGFISLAHSIAIKKPFVTLSLRLNQSEDKDFFTRIGDQIRGEISFVNNLPITINDAEIKVNLSGIVFDRESVRANRGFYRSVENSITWDKNNVPELGTIGPGVVNSVNFDFSSIPSTQALISSGRNMEMQIDVAVKGTRIGEGSGPQTVSSSFSRKIKIATNLQLNGRSLYSIGPLRNTGPIPPRAEQNTSYTVAWTLSNTFNDVTGASVTATLPQYVRWLGNVNPSSENVTYNESNRTITWNAGEIRAGSGFMSPPREVYFQISLQPSLDQVGSSPILVDNIKFSGMDRFTGKAVSETRSPLTTRTSTDPAYNLGNETVVR